VLDGSCTSVMSFSINRFQWVLPPWTNIKRATLLYEKRSSLNFAWNIKCFSWHSFIQRTESCW
jgi:hypothetical protein